MEPFVFIVGCARSGTTLLQRIMDANPRLPARVPAPLGEGTTVPHDNRERICARRALSAGSAV